MNLSNASLFLMLTGSPAYVAAQAPVADEFRSGMARCAELAVDAERLRCFDRIAARMAATSTPAAEQAAEVRDAEPAIQPLPDDIGEHQDQVYTTTVVRCEESRADRRHYFYFDNGQVWQQSNSGPLRIDECAGAAFIEKDVFGYKLRFEGDTYTIRVRRVQ